MDINELTEEEIAHLERRRIRKRKREKSVKKILDVFNCLPYWKNAIALNPNTKLKDFCKDYYKKELAHTGRWENFTKFFNRCWAFEYIDKK